MALSVLTPGKPSPFKLKKRVTDMLIKLEDNVEYVCKFDEAMYRAPDTGRARKAKEGEEPSQPPMLMRATFYDNETAAITQIGVIIVPYVLERELTDNFPDNSYVGKIFQFAKVKVQMKGGRSVNQFQIAEVGMTEDGEEVNPETGELPVQPETPQSEAPKTGKKK